MCFAPQRRALSRHLNFQKWCENAVFCTFWLRNVLRATTACNFSSLIWPAGSAPAALASLLFDSPEPQIIGKTQCFATFLPFRASASAFFWLFLFSDLLSSTLLFSLPLPCSAFHLSILSEVWLLNFLRSIMYIIPIFLGRSIIGITNKTGMITMKTMPPFSLFSHHLRRFSAEELVEHDPKGPPIDAFGVALPLDHLALLGDIFWIG